MWGLFWWPPLGIHSVSDRMMLGDFLRGGFYLLHNWNVTRYDWISWYVQCRGICWPVLHLVMYPNFKYQVSSHYHQVEQSTPEHVPGCPLLIYQWNITILVGCIGKYHPTKTWAVFPWQNRQRPAVAGPRWCSTTPRWRIWPTSLWPSSARATMMRKGPWEATGKIWGRKYGGTMVEPGCDCELWGTGGIFQIQLRRVS